MYYESVFLLISTFWTKDYQKSSGIKIYDQLGNSLDLNPIENVWHTMGSEISEKKKKMLLWFDYKKASIGLVIMK